MFLFVCFVSSLFMYLSFVCINLFVCFFSYLFRGVFMSFVLSSCIDCVRYFFISSFIYFVVYCLFI